jgi:hypothetical protein
MPRPAPFPNYRNSRRDGRNPWGPRPNIRVHALDGPTVLRRRACAAGLEGGLAQAMGPTIYLARHGERLDFVDPSWCDTAENPHDAPLTARGEQQARELGVRLRDCNIAHVFASPFSRVTCTAVRAAAELANPCRVKLESGNCEWLNAGKRTLRLDARRRQRSVVRV